MKPENDNSPDPASDGQGTESNNWREQRRKRRHEMYDRRNRDPLRGLFWSLVLILVGVLFFINQQQGIDWNVLWKYLLIGLGAIFFYLGSGPLWESSLSPGQSG